MRILLVHNFYQQPGGEDRIFEVEGALLEAYGHTVSRYTIHNDLVNDMNRLALAKATFWNGRVYRELEGLVRRTQAQVVHFHNTLPLVSPAGYYAVRRAGAAVVQTLHNYRLMCPGALFLRDGRPCEDCLGRSFAWNGIKHGCYRGSRVATAFVAGTVAAHRKVGTWGRKIDEYIALTHFARNKFIQGGLPAGRITVKPHFVEVDPGIGGGRGGYALYVGRLSEEKGIQTVLKTWREHAPALDLKIVGDGPLAGDVEALTQADPRVSWLGRRLPQEVYALMKEAHLVIIPSECYETFGRVAIESFATGTPVLASNMGAVAEVVENGKTGRHFESGNARDLADQLAWIQAHPNQWQQMRRTARTAYESHYTAVGNYRQLMHIYEKALARIGQPVAEEVEETAIPALV